MKFHSTLFILFLSLILSFSIFSVSKAQINQTLRPGDLDPQVTILQKILNALGKNVTQPGEETIYYGSQTANAVKAFQCEKGIVCEGDADSTGYGIVGPKTLGVLNSIFSSVRNIFTSTTASAQLAQVAPASPAAYYNFDEGSGTTVNDTSGNGRNGSTVNGTTWTSGGKIGGALDFDGVDDKVNTVADYIGTGPVSVSAWINPRGFGAGNPRILDNGNFYVGLRGDSSTVQVRNANNTPSFAAIGGISLNTWQFITVTRNGNIINLYINGVLSGAANQTNDAPVAGNRNITIGNRQEDTQHVFNGLIDDVRIYNRVLDSSEIASLYAYTGGGGGGGGTPATTYSLSVTSVSNGTVTSSPSGISCGSTCSVSGISAGTSYTLTAAPASGYTTSWSGCASANGNTCNVTVNSNITVTPTFSLAASGDTTPPSTPGAVTATAISSSQINLSWGASSDNVGVTGYRVYRGGSQITSVTSGTTYSDTGLSASTAYSYTVAAYDAANNVSTQTAASSATTAAGTTQAPGTFREVTYTSGLNAPVMMAWAPDGRLFVTEKGGRVRVIKNGVLQTTPFATVTVDSQGERGLLGITFDPNFASNRYVYVYYTATGPSHNRISRFTASAGNPDVSDGTETVLFNLDTLGAANNHNGGGLNFGFDGKLYATAGENVVDTNAQLLTNVLGKVLRLNPDGSIPSDNPTSFPGVTGTTAGNNRAIWAIGLRNPFSFAIDPSNGTMYINDVGSDAWEEINRGTAGANYGWSVCEGIYRPSSFTNPCPMSQQTAPVYAYQHGGGAAIAGGAFYRGSQFPSTYNGAYFFSDYVRSTISVLYPNNQVQLFLNTSSSAPTDIKVGPDGSLYYVSVMTGRIIQVLYQGGTVNRIPTAFISANPASSATIPMSVSFSASGSSDPDGDPLTYSWNFGDGGTASGLTINHTYTVGGTYSAAVTVSDGKGGTDIKTVQIVAGAAPVATITAPTVGTLFGGGQTITYRGTGTTASGTALPASAYSWTIVFHHATHTHPFLGPITGVTTGTFVVPSVTETDPDVYYRIHLTVTDASGVSTEVTRDIQPRLVNVTLGSNPAGLQLTIDARAGAGPFTVSSVEGVSHTLGAVASQSLAGTNYTFGSWSDGGAANHSVVAPAAGGTYTATYSGGGTPASAITADMYTDFENGTVGNAMTAANLNASTHGTGGTWTLSANGVTGTAISSNESQLHTPVTVAGVTYDDAGGSRGFSANLNPLYDFAQYGFTSNKANLSLGTYLTMGSIGTSFATIDHIILTTTDGSWCVAQTSSSMKLRAHARNSTTAPNGTGPDIPVVAGKTYWITLQAISNAQCSLEVYDATTWALVGSSALPYQNSGTSISSVRIGRADNHGGGQPPATSYDYFDDLVLNWTTAPFPLGPGAGGTSGGGTTNPPASTKFAVNQRVQTTSNLNVRTSPSTSAALAAGTPNPQTTGALGTVVGGPTNADGFNWWNVNYDSGADGWSAEDFLGAAATSQTATLTIIPGGSGTGTVSGTGITCGTDCSETVSTGGSITVTATPATGSTFAGWSGGGCSTAASCTITLSGSVVVNATFNSTQPTQQTSYDCTLANVRCVSNAAGTTANGTSKEYATVQTCATAAVAGDFCVVASTGTPYDERVNPARSGTAGNPITFVGDAGSTKAKVRAFSLISDNYITVKGFELTNIGMTSKERLAAIYLDTANHNRILDNYIHNTSGDGNGECVHFEEGNSTHFSNYNLVKGNTIHNCSDQAQGGGHSGIGMVIVGNENTIENNDISHLGDDYMRFLGGFRNVVRNNLWHDNFLGDWPGGTAHIDGIQTWSSSNEGNPVTNFLLIENTKLLNGPDHDTHFSLYQNYSAVDNGDYVLRYNTAYELGDAVHIHDRQTRDVRLYNNTWGRAGWQHNNSIQISYSNNSPGGKFINNIIYNNRSAGSGGYSVDSGSAAGFFGSNNHAYSDNYTGSWSGRIAGEPTYSYFQNKDPMFNNVAAYDFTLRSSSPDIDAGGPLTTTTGAGSGTTITVGDAGMFQDGWGGGAENGVYPDWIAVGTPGNVAQIVSINVNTDTITLASPLSAWTSGAPVYLFKDSDGTQVLYGNAPDVGANESGSTGGPVIIPTNPTLFVSNSNTAFGTVTGTGINCGIDCSQAVNAGTSITLTATPIAPATFTGWSGAGCTGTGTCTVTVNSNTTVTATFASTQVPTTGFAIGGRIQLASNTNARSSAALGGATNLIGQNPAGTLGTIIAGPTVADGITWWNVNFDTGFDGWSGEDNFISITPAGSNKFIIGDAVAMNASGINVRSTAGGAVSGQHTTGDTGTVLGGPTTAAVSGISYTWWNINFTSGVDGWVAEDFLNSSSGPGPVVNTPPVVNAGVDRAINLPSNITLAGTASDDGVNGSTLATTWSMVTGPGNVTFSSTSSLTPTLTFSLAGTYNLRLTATDGSLSSTDDVAITVGADSPPIRSAGQPSTALAAGTTGATLSLSTNENATCRYSTTANTAYSSMTNNFTITGAMSHTRVLSGLTAGSQSFYVRCADSLGNANTDDFPILFSIQSAVVTQDNIAPSISLSSPLNNQTVAPAAIAVTAAASDNVGVVGVQFLLNNLNLGAEDTTSPYGLNWDAASLPNGTYELKAVARDAANNRTTSVSVFITLARPVVPSPSSSPQGGGGATPPPPPTTVVTASAQPGALTNVTQDQVMNSVRGVTSQPTGIAAASFTKTLVLGTRDAEVKILQQVLNIQGIHVTNTGAETTYFGPATRAALIRYQTINSLPVTGILDAVTRAKINGLGQRITSPVTATPVTTVITSSSFARPLKTGTAGADVKVLQIFLNDHGFAVSTTGAGSKGKETLYYGPATARAVARFQEAYKAEVLAPAGLTRGTGYFGPASIRKAKEILNGSMSAPTSTSTSTTTSAR